MVTKLPPHLTSAIAAAIESAERRTCAEVAVVVSPASDVYQPYLLMYGFALGSLLDVALWWTKTVTPFPLLMLLQALCMAGFAFIPFLREAGHKLIPAKVLHHHAARRAHEEFQVLTRNIAPDKPAVLLYVSLAERYAHILHSRDIDKKIPHGAWNAIMADFTSQMTSQGLRGACEQAIAAIAGALAAHFPK